MNFKAFLFIGCCLLAGCSNNDSIKPISNGTTPAAGDSSVPVQKKTVPQAQTAAGTVAPANAKVPTDTLITVVDSTEDNDRKAQGKMLEVARQFYKQALRAQQLGDSLLAQSNFEEAINNLNEVSYFPGIDANNDFNELNKSVIEDYEKYIASVDTLAPQSSIDALHEKMYDEVEKIDISNIVIPPNFIPKTTVPLVMNDYVKRSIAFFATRGRSHLEHWISLSGRYFPMMFKIFKEEGVPEEMVYLSMPESGLNATVRSWAKAVGLWQFMKGTGALYGLRGNFWYDERRDPEKATRAAARHLKDLYAQYNDWYLVLVGYNAGGGRVNRGIRKSGTYDFWAMRDNLPKETRNYIPQYIAVTLMAMKPEPFGLKVEKEDTLRYEAVSIDDCVDLSVLAECAGTTLDSLRELNPELLQWCTPPNYKGYRLKVPVGTSARFNERYAQLPPEKKQDWIAHMVRRGETPSSVAKRYGLLTSVLLEVNHLPRSKKLKPGSTLLIPMQGHTVLAKLDRQAEEDALRESSASVKKGKAIAADDEELAVPAGKTKLIYKTKKGEKLTVIAKRFAVRVTDIRNWNDIEYGKTVRAGAKITLFVPNAQAASYKSIAGVTVEQKSTAAKHAALHDEANVKTSAVHKVTSGETLAKIAKDADVTIDDLKEWNKLTTSVIKVGQKIKTQAPAAAVADAPSPKTKASAKEKAMADKADVKKSAAKEKTIAEKTDAAAAKTKNHAAAPATHIVKNGETLEKIAKASGVTIEDLKAWNDLSGSKIKIGDKLIVEGSAAAAAEEPPARASAKKAAKKSAPAKQTYVTYSVKRGDTLERISKKFDVAVAEIKKWNDLSTNRIKAGDKIKIQQGVD
jgi:membrane-bound lytic murein transglycosylase D